MKKLILILVGILSIISCRWLSMEVVDLRLKLNNNSDQKIKVLLNTSYPDSTLHLAFPDSYLDPHSSGHIGAWGVRWDSLQGITVFIFKWEYYDSNKKVGAHPDEYLDENMILKKWILTKAQLDSIDWKIYYP